MNLLTIIILTFSILGALDRIFGNRFGIGKEFEKASAINGDITTIPTIESAIVPISTKAFSNSFPMPKR